MLDKLLSSAAVAEALSIIRSEFPLAIWETLYVTLLATAFACVLGLPLGILLVVGEKDGVLPLPGWLIKAIGAVVNLLRSVPFLILMIIALPLSKLIVGTKVGTMATVPPMVIAAFPLVARMVESSLREVDQGVIEAAQSMGASPWQIAVKVMLPEALPSLISGCTISVGTILGYGAMAGIIGGGGLGKIAINYGYYNFKYLVMWAAVIGLILLVQIFQSGGTWLGNKCDKRLKNRS